MTIRRYTETISGDGNGQIYEVEGNAADDDELKSIVCTLTGSFNGASIMAQADAGAVSPGVFAAAADTAHTAAKSFLLKLPPGHRFRFNTSASGSPVPAVTAVVRGHIKKSS